ncbi:MAG: hypothetical protein ACXADY_15565 [Candidatus Hodarchaeales archaeon]|jgi:hypothetical protein
MTRIQIIVYKQLWEYLLQHGMRTIEIIDEEEGWEFRIFPQEYSVKETFYHTIQAIYEDANRWFLDTFSKFIPTGNPSKDLIVAINHMITAFEKLTDEELSNGMTFQWGEKTTISGAIQQNLFHAVGHFSQLRNWIGIMKRTKGKSTRKDIL